MKQIQVVSAFLALIIIAGCSKELPCTKERYIGKFRVESIYDKVNFATIEPREDSEEITLDINNIRYPFTIDATNKCNATYKGKNFGIGLLLPCGNMTLSNKQIDVKITTYILFIPLTYEYTLIR